MDRRCGGRRAAGVGGCRASPSTAPGVPAGHWSAAGERRSRGLAALAPDARRLGLQPARPDQPGHRPPASEDL